jgi:hypothetical protein
MAKGGSKKQDNLEAARTVRDALKGFERGEQEQILRWAAESLGINPQSSAPTPPPRPPQPAVPPAPTDPPAPNTPTPKNVKDVAQFVDDKNPKTDIQLATTILYYYRFEAPENERKDDMSAEELRDALRKAGKPGELTKPAKTLANAHQSGFLDRGERGRFSINTVGENLVGMTLPGKATKKAATK